MIVILCSVSWSLPIFKTMRVTVRQIINKQLKIPVYKLHCSPLGVGLIECYCPLFGRLSPADIWTGYYLTLDTFNWKFNDLWNFVALILVEFTLDTCHNNQTKINIGHLWAFGVFVVYNVYWMVYDVIVHSLDFDRGNTPLPRAALSLVDQ